MNKKPPETGASLLGNTSQQQKSRIKKIPATLSGDGLSAPSRINCVAPEKGLFIKTKPRFRIAEAEDYYPAHFVQAQWASIKIPDPLRGSGFSAPSRI
jgi:hypothetical protein